MKNRIMVYLLLVILLFAIVLFVLTNNKYDSGKTDSAPESFSFDDSYMLRVISIIPYEYLKIEGFRPDNTVMIGSKNHFNDSFHCETQNSFANKYLTQGNKCIIPHYWKDYSFDYDGGRVIMGFRVFEDKDMADDYVTEQLTSYTSVAEQNNLYSHIIESRTIITPTEIGRMISQISFIEIEDTSMEKQYMLLSLIITNNTVYTIFEESQERVRDRQYLYAFTEEYHEAAIRILNVTLLT